MSAIIANLAEFGIDPTMIFADFDCLGDGEGPITLGDRVIYPKQGYTIDPEWADDEATVPVTFESLFDTFEFRDSINLRANNFAKKRLYNFNTAGLATSAALLIVLAVSYLILQTAKIGATNLQVKALRAEAEMLYTQSTGEAAPANPALAVTRAIKSGSTPNHGFLVLSGILLPAVQTVDGIEVETLQFDLEKNQLRLRLIYPAFESATEFEQAVAANGGILQVGGVREVQGKFIGDAVLRNRGGHE